MSKQAFPILTLTIAATATLVAERFVTQAGAVPAADANVLGVVRQAAVSGDKVTVDVLGTAIVEAGGGQKLLIFGNVKRNFVQKYFKISVSDFEKKLKLKRKKDGRIFGGVCTGISVHLNINP